MKKYEEGFYYLYTADELEPVLVHGYNCTDMGGEFVFGFNAHDGGGLLPLSDLRSDSKFVKVIAIETKETHRKLEQFKDY